jgi:hypothetical protein
VHVIQDHPVAVQNSASQTYFKSELADVAGFAAIKTAYSKKYMLML